MKKLFTVLLAVSMVLLLVACQLDDSNTLGQTTTTPSTNSTSTTTTTAPGTFIEYPGNTGIALTASKNSLPDNIYSTTGEQNGLTGTVYAITGTVESLKNISGYTFLIISTGRGEVAVSDTLAMVKDIEDVNEYGGINEDVFRAYYPLPSVGDKIRIIAEYQGLSDAINMAVFMYASSDYLTEVLMLSVNEPDGTEATGPSTAPSTAPPPTTLPPVTDPPATQPITTEPQISVGMKNALKTANGYLKFMPFSYGGLIDQLEYEGYTNAEATYAADNCGADWNTQALKSAESYLDFSAFSYSGLIDQLEYEQFTTAQAIYAADNCGADWNEQAAKCAATYLDIMAFSRFGLIEQLEFDGFTHEQAVYGVEANGL